MAGSLLFWSVLSLLLRSVWGGDDVNVGFVMMQHIKCGQQFKIIGNSKELGDWDISKGISMTHHKGDLWTASTKINSEGSNGECGVEYKAVVVDFDDEEKEVCSMPGSNRVLKIPKDSDSDSIFFVHVIWDKNTCSSSCSLTPACNTTSIIVNTHAKIHKSTST